MNPFRTLIVLGFASVGIMLIGCKANKNKPGTIYMPDMHYSNAWEAYDGTHYHSENDTVYEDSVIISARKPVAGTIPFGSLPNVEGVRISEAGMQSYFLNELFKDPALYPEVNNEQYEKSSMLINPVPKTAAAFEEGKILYVKNCAVCHGDKGMGDGSIVTGTTREDGSDGPYTAVPPAYDQRLPALTDGQMFYSITYGKGMMGPYRSHLSVDDRWKVVYYIKKLAGLDAPDAVPQLGLDSLEATGALEAGYEMDIPGIYFNYNSSALHPASASTLNQLADYLKDQDLHAVLGGHTDSRGSGAYNMKLSTERAESVRSYLISKGVKASRLKAKGYGATDPAVDCTACSEADHAKNRRTTFSIVSEDELLADDHDMHQEEEHVEDHGEEDAHGEHAEGHHHDETNHDH